MSKFTLFFCFAGTLFAGEKFPKFDFKDQLVAPVRIHLMKSKGEPNLTTTLSEQDIQRILSKVNHIWAQAGVHFTPESIVHESIDNPDVYRQNLQSRQLRWLLALRPRKSRLQNCFHIYYIKQFGVNGVFLSGDGMFVKDTARLRPVKGGLDEPIPRVTAHELGHALSLQHRQHVTNLLASGTTGWTLNREEIKQARMTASKTKWIRPAGEILREADGLHQQEKKIEAAALYRRIAAIPLRCPETTRARKRADR
ncbi:MAG: Matrixin [Verrucomicrobiota bacterium]|nr:Matrixin [Verrucomicrobiota bacterium]